jgi:hypothetical protein
MIVLSQNKTGTASRMLPGKHASRANVIPDSVLATSILALTPRAEGAQTARIPQQNLEERAARIGTTRLLVGGGLVAGSSRGYTGREDRAG